jgi:hypothetical protein
MQISIQAVAILLPISGTEQYRILSLYSVYNLIYHCRNLIYHCTIWLSLHLRIIPTGTTGAAGASAPHAFCIHNFLGALQVQTMCTTGAQKIQNK